MRKKEQKFWTKYYRIKEIPVYILITLLIYPLLTVFIGGRFNSEEMNQPAGTPINWNKIFIDGLPIASIIIFSIVGLLIFWLFMSSGHVKFTDDGIENYRFITSKKHNRLIEFEKITDCIFNCGLWNSKRSPGRRIQIILYNKSNVLATFDINCKLMLKLIEKLGYSKVFVVGETNTLRTLNNYFKIDFESLTYEQQMILLKYYGKLTRGKYRTGEEILRRAKKFDLTDK